MTYNFDELIQKVAASTTIEESFLIFLDNLTDELSDVEVLHATNDLKELISQLEKYRIPFATAMASNISAS